MVYTLVIDLIGQLRRDVIVCQLSRDVIGYVHLDDRANDLLTTTSVTQVTSDEFDDCHGRLN